jgi:ABC-type multidrug transport system fused ATPase/permease subunit
VTLAGIPLSAIGLSILTSKMQSSIIDQEREMAKASSLTINALSSIDTVKCFNGQDSEVRQYGLVLKKVANFYLKQARHHSCTASPGPTKLSCLDGTAVPMKQVTLLILFSWKLLVTSLLFAP